MMHDAVQTYLETSGVSSFNIQAIALEGQGQVEDRVNKLYSQLTGREEWIQALEKADVVFLATHSQGTVVSTQLLARMLDQKLIVGTQTHLSVFLSSSFPSVANNSLIPIICTQTCDVRHFTRSFRLLVSIGSSRSVFQLLGICRCERVVRFPRCRICSINQVPREVRYS